MTGEGEQAPILFRVQCTFGGQSRSFRVDSWPQFFMHQFTGWVCVTLAFWFAAPLAGAQSVGEVTRGAGPSRPRVDDTVHEPAGSDYGILADRPLLRRNRETPAALLPWYNPKPSGLY